MYEFPRKKRYPRFKKMKNPAVWGYNHEKVTIVDQIRELFKFQDQLLRFVQSEKPELLTGSIKEEFESGKPFPVSIKGDFSVLIDKISALFAAGNLLEGLFGKIPIDLRKIEKIFESKNCTDFISNFKEFIDISRLAEAPEVAGIQPALRLRMLLLPRRKQVNGQLRCREAFN